MSGGIINIKNIYLQFNGALQVNYFTFYLGFLFILELRVGIVVYLIGSNRVQFGVNWEASILNPNYIQKKNISCTIASMRIAIMHLVTTGSSDLV